MNDEEVASDEINAKVTQKIKDLKKEHLANIEPTNNISANKKLEYRNSASRKMQPDELDTAENK